MKNSVYILLVVVLIISISGCTTFNNIFGVNQAQRKEGANDIVVVKSVDMVPAPPILPGQPFNLMITIGNNDKKYNAELVDVVLFDPSIFSIRNNKKSEAVGTLLPLSEKVVNFFLVAPPASETGNVILSPVINYLVRYWFRSITNFDVVTVSLKELSRRQKSGKPVSVSVENVMSSGPIQINAKLINANYLLVDPNRPQEEKNMYDVLMGVKVINRGSGELDGSWIEPCMMYLKFPDEVRGITQVPDYWWCGTTSPYDIPGIINSGEPIENSRQLKAICEKLLTSATTTSSSTTTSSTTTVPGEVNPGQAQKCAQYNSITCDVNDPSTDCCDFGIPGLSCRCLPKESGGQKTCPKNEDINNLPYATCVSSTQNKVFYTSNAGTVTNNGYCDYNFDKSLNCPAGSTCCQLPVDVGGLHAGKPGCYPTACCNAAPGSSEAQSACSSVTKSKWTDALSNGIWPPYGNANYGNCYSPYEIYNCQDTSTPCKIGENGQVDGKYISGYCPGGSNIQCCVPQDVTSGNIVSPKNLNGLNITPTENTSGNIITGMALPAGCIKSFEWDDANLDPITNTLNTGDPNNPEASIHIVFNPSVCQLDKYDYYIDVEENRPLRNADIIDFKTQLTGSSNDEDVTITLYFNKLFSSDENTACSSGYTIDSGNAQLQDCPHGQIGYNDKYGVGRPDIIFRIKQFDKNTAFDTRKEGISQTETKMIDVYIPNGHSDCDSDSDCYSGSHCSGPTGWTGAASDEGDFCCPACTEYDYDAKQCLPGIPEAKGFWQKAWDKVNNIMNWASQYVNINTVAYAGDTGIAISTGNGNWNVGFIKKGSNVYSFAVGSNGISSNYIGKDVYLTDGSHKKISIGYIKQSSDGTSAIMADSKSGTVQVAKIGKSENGEYAIAFNGNYKGLADKIGAVIFGTKTSDTCNPNDLILKATGKSGDNTAGTTTTSSTTTSSTTTITQGKSCSGKVLRTKCEILQDCKTEPGNFIECQGQSDCYCCSGTCTSVTYNPVTIDTTLSNTERKFQDNEFKKWCINYRPIETFKGQSAQHIFRLRPMVYTDVYQTSRIKIAADYAYVIRGSKEIKIEPFGR